MERLQGLPELSLEQAVRVGIVLRKEGGPSTLRVPDGVLQVLDREREAIARPVHDHSGIASAMTWGCTYQ